MNAQFFLKTLPCSMAGVDGIADLSVLRLRLQRQGPKGDGAPPPAHVIQVADMNLITIDSNDVAKFPLVTAGKS